MLKVLYGTIKTKKVLLWHREAPLFLRVYLSFMFVIMILLPTHINLGSKFSQVSVCSVFALKFHFRKCIFGIVSESLPE